MAADKFVCRDGYFFTILCIVLHANDQLGVRVGGRAGRDTVPCNIIASSSVVRIAI